MLTVNKQQTKDGLTVDLIGAIEETTQLDQLIGPFTGELTVKCRGVTRINSVGVKSWIRYFQNLKLLGHKFQFVECSYAIVAQLNMISNFDCGGKVVSLLLPYSCSKCGKDFVSIAQTDELKKNKFQIPKVRCEKTDCEATLDDHPDEYLYFLKD